MSAACEAKLRKARSRLRERREAQDRRSRPRALAAADAQSPISSRTINEAARRRVIEARPTQWRCGLHMPCKEAEA